MTDHSAAGKKVLSNRFGLTHLRGQLGRAVQDAYWLGDRWIIHKNRKPVAAIVSYTDAQAMIEADQASTLEYRKFQAAEKMIHMEAVHLAMNRIHDEITAAASEKPPP